MYNSGYGPVPYEEDYFTGSYREQYGKTYCEDHENIRKISLGRINLIAGLLGKRDLKALRLLDIGSALGFFLNCARDSGIGEILGIEISRYASERAREDLGIETVNSSFSDYRADECFDVVTAWYFIEHAENPSGALKKIYDMLCEDGIMGISVPSYFGPRYLFSREQWIREFPGDHRVEFSPGVITRLLKEIGFSRVKVVPAGIHPERIMRKSSFLYPIFAQAYRVISRILKFSDTLEVYAVKDRGQM